LGPYEGCRCGVAIVDDERALVDVYEKILHMKGIPVCFVAYDGEEAVRQFEQHNPRPCVVLMDYRMPGTDGIEATKRILRMDSKVKVIFISADEGVKSEAIRAGAVMFVQKPASVKDIVKAVESVEEIQIQAMHRHCRE
jgi:two-component system chemotaxis response regulator CheY